MTWMKKILAYDLSNNIYFIVKVNDRVYAMLAIGPEGLAPL